MSGTFNLYDLVNEQYGDVIPNGNANNEHSLLALPRIAMEDNSKKRKREEEEDEEEEVVTPRTSASASLLLGVGDNALSLQRPGTTDDDGLRSCMW